jgi:hypothetical protein
MFDDILGLFPRDVVPGDLVEIPLDPLEVVHFATKLIISLTMGRWNRA